MLISDIIIITLTTKPECKSQEANLSMVLFYDQDIIVRRPNLKRVTCGSL